MSSNKKSTKFVSFDPWDSRHVAQGGRPNAWRVTRAATAPKVILQRSSSSADDVLPSSINMRYDSEDSETISRASSTPPSTTSGQSPDNEEDQGEEHDSDTSSSTLPMGIWPLLKDASRICSRKVEDKPQVSSQSSTIRDGKPRPSDLQLERLDFQTAPYLPTPYTFGTYGSSPTLPTRPVRDLTLSPRRPNRGPPILGKVYYLPEGRHFPSSVIHQQKRQNGFFRHPMLVVGVEGPDIWFYALTSMPPHAISELGICLQVGNISLDQGPGVLALSTTSSVMKIQTWVNLEQLFRIEWRNVDEWADNVQIALHEHSKIWNRVQQMESTQNRYIYKPLWRDLSCVQPGTVLMMPNNEHSGTLGAPIVVVENRYPYLWYLRVKVLSQNVNFNIDAPKNIGVPRHMCLQITKFLGAGHEGTPVMLLEPNSPEMREPSYVEVARQPTKARLDRLKTWCWPPVMIRQESMTMILEYAKMCSQSVPLRSPIGYSFLPPTLHMPYPAQFIQHGPVVPQHQGYHHNHHQAVNAYTFYSAPPTPQSPYFLAPSGYSHHQNFHPATYSPHDPRFHGHHA